MRVVLTVAVLLLGACAGNGPLGNVVPKTSHWLNLVDASTWNGSVVFTDDDRNTCAAINARMEFGNSALLFFNHAETLSAGQPVTWITDADARAGKGPSNSAVFVADSLSGLDLRTKSGTATLEKLPGPSEKTFAVHLVASDGSLDTRLTASPLCP